MIKLVQLCIVSLKVTELPWHWRLTESHFIVSHIKATGLWIWDVWEPYTITSEKIQNTPIYGCKTNLIKTLSKRKRTRYDKNASMAEKLAGLLERNSPTACRGIWEAPFPHPGLAGYLGGGEVGPVKARSEQEIILLQRPRLLHILHAEVASGFFSYSPRLKQPYCI